MIKKNYLRSKPSFANINLLGKCNLRCFFCLGGDLEEEFSKYNQLNVPPNKLKNLDKFLLLCRNHGIENVYITGQNTDSLLYQHLDELIDYLQDKWGFKVGLRTNGLLAEKKVNTINKCHKSISYTLLTLKPETMKKITGVARIPDFNFIFNNVRIQQRVATVITEHNVKEILNLIKFVSKYPQIKYFQIRRISTDTRYREFRKPINLFDELLEKIKKRFKQIGEFELAPIFDIYGVKVVFWKTVETSVNSFNYFSNGVISDEYFIVEGYTKNKNKYIDEKLRGKNEFRP